MTAEPQTSPTTPAASRSLPQEILQAQVRILEELTVRRAMREVLQEVCRILEGMIEGVRCCVMLFDPSGEKVNLGAAPSLPEDLRSQLDGLPIGPEAGPRTAALVPDETVVIGDFAEDKLWPEFSECALDAGLRSCWSTPVRSRMDTESRHLLGSLAFFYDRVREPDAEAVKLLETSAQLVSFAIENAYSTEYVHRQASSSDLLTGLATRTLFQERLQETIQENKSKKVLFAVMILDIDQLKNINDIVGFTVGDYLLQAIGKRLRGCVRKHDAVARAGGDEFLLFFQDIRRDEDVPLIAKKVMKKVQSPYDFKGHPLFVTTKIGISVYPWDGEDAVTLIRNAETALSAAKEEGRNDYQIFRPTMVRDQPTFESWSHQLRLGNDLRDVVERDQLELYYQLKVSADWRKPCGAEALVRWRHPTLGILLPMEFLPMAEQTGLILSLDSWILRTACLQNKDWKRLGLADMRIAVNVSAQQFRYGNLVEIVKKTLEETGLSPEYLELEVSEDLTMEDVETNLHRVRELRELGVKIAVDDFGTGFSSLSHLTKLRIDALKIDRSFVQLIGVSKNGEAIVRSIISIASNLKLEVVAEGVETKEQFDFLSRHKCDVIQGFYINKPMPAQEFTRLLQNRVY